MDKHLHIISHDVPWPADYGGVVDIFQTLVWLKKAGIKIHLHCFTKGRKPAAELNRHCETVHYYKRKKSGIASVNIPYIVKSRSSDELIHELEKDNYPVLMQGMHCTWPLFRNKLPGRKVFIRSFNVEHVYYDFLATHEKNKLKKIYFKRESRLLKPYEKNMAAKAPVLTLSENDRIYFSAPGGNASFIPALLPWQELLSKTGMGDYCLYHGNLSVNENEKAVEWLLTELFHTNEIPIVIAGKDPSPKLAALVAKTRQASLVSNPPDAAMQELIENAQINLLPSFNNTGVKLKLLNALYNGRHCVANSTAVAGSGAEALCSIGNTAAEMQEHIRRLFTEPFSQKEIQHRGAVLNGVYNNEINAAKITALIQ
ncbi:MAG: glycosyltransferase family 4 protein [Ferruginibacter sp.]